MPRKSDIRRHERVSEAAPVQINWKDRLGNEKFANGQILDVSEAGLRFKAPESIAEHTLVTLRADKLALHGRGSVRSCVRQGSLYLIGLEFIRWLEMGTQIEEITTERGHRKMALIRCDGY